MLESTQTEFSFAVEVHCPVCKSVGVYEAPAAAQQGEDARNWASLPCFFTSGCPGHVWPEQPN